MVGLVRDPGRVKFFANNEKAGTIGIRIKAVQYAHQLGFLGIPRSGPAYVELFRRKPVQARELVRVFNVAYIGPDPL
jgi:hypothetical protein